MMSYTIKAKGFTSRRSTTYRGEFHPVAGEHPIVTALAREFANGSVEELKTWLGGDAEIEDIEEDAVPILGCVPGVPAGYEYDLCGNDTDMLITVRS